MSNEPYKGWGDYHGRNPRPATETIAHPLYVKLKAERDHWRQVAEDRLVAANGYLARATCCRAVKMTDLPVDTQLYDKRGIPIERGDVVKVFHFIGACRKRHYMHKHVWVFG